MVANTLATVEIDPTAPAKHSLIWLHGLGADGNDFVPMVSELKLPPRFNVRYIFPHAPLMPITINQGQVMRAWYDIPSISIEAKPDENNIAKSITAIENLIQKEMNRGIPSTHIILAGFSQGAAITLLTGLGYPKPLGGMIALSGYLPLAIPTADSKYSINRNTPIFMAHGTHDTIVPYVLGQTSCSFLQNSGFNVSWHSYLMPHTVTPVEINDIRHWLMERWTGKQLNQK